MLIKGGISKVICINNPHEVYEGSNNFIAYNKYKYRSSGAGFEVFGENGSVLYFPYRLFIPCFIDLQQHRENLINQLI